MKQKAMIKVSMNCNKCRAKAMKIAVGMAGVESASLKGDDKSQIEVTGDGFDTVELTRKLRKNVGHAVLISVAEDKKEDKKDDKKDEKPNIVCYGAGVPANYHYCYEVRPDPYCSIM